MTDVLVDALRNTLAGLSAPVPVPIFTSDAGKNGLWTMAAKEKGSRLTRAVVED